MSIKRLFLACIVLMLLPSNEHKTSVLRLHRAAATAKQ
jgi:hypothetical protein